MYNMDGLIMRYFVLSPLKDSRYGLASRAAILTYADIIESVNSRLALDLRHWALQIETAIKDAHRAKEQLIEE